MTTRPRQGPQPRQARLDPVDPMERVVGSGRAALLGEPCQGDLVEQAVGLERGCRRPVVRQRHPRRQRLLARSHGVVVLGTELMTETALVLTMTATRDDGVDVHGVDLAGEAVTSSGVVRGALRQQDQHDDGAEVVVGEVRDAAGRRDQARVEPEVADLGRIGAEQRRRRLVRLVPLRGRRWRRHGPRLSSSPRRIPRGRPNDAHHA